MSPASARWLAASLLALSFTSLALQAEEIRIETPQKAVLVFTTGRKFVGELESLNSKEVRFRLGGKGTPILYKATQLKEVQLADQTLVYNAEKGQFEKQEIPERDAGDVLVDMAQPAYFMLGNGRQVVGQLLLLSTKEVKCTIAGKTAQYTPPQIRAVQIKDDLFVFNAEKGAFESVKAQLGQNAFGQNPGQPPVAGPGVNPMNPALPPMNPGVPPLPPNRPPFAAPPQNPPALPPGGIGGPIETIWKCNRCGKEVARGPVYPFHIKNCPHCQAASPGGAPPATIPPMVPPMGIPATPPSPVTGPPATPFGNPAPSFPNAGANTQQMVKQCTQCKNTVASSAKAGDKCPHCGIVWDFEQDASGAKVAYSSGYWIKLIGGIATLIVCAIGALARWSRG